MNGKCSNYIQICRTNHIEGVTWVGEPKICRWSLESTGCKTGGRDGEAWGRPMFSSGHLRANN